MIKYGDVYLRLYRESDYADPIFKRDIAEQKRTALNESLNEFDLFNDDPEESEQLTEAVNLHIHPEKDKYDRLGFMR